MQCLILISALLLLLLLHGAAPAAQRGQENTSKSNFIHGCIPR
jgi:hypothetical protein